MSTPTSAPTSTPTLIEAAVGGAYVGGDAPAFDAPPRAVEAWSFDDWASLVGGVLGSLAITWLLYTQLLPTSGKLGFCLVWYGTFLAVYAVVTAISHRRTIVVDRLAGAVVGGGAGVVGLALAWVVLSTYIRGWAAYHHLNFFTHDMAGIGPLDPLTQGGIYHAIVGTLIEISIAVAISLPLGLGTAIYMTEVRGRLSRAVRTVVEAMTALPDLIAGLFIYTFLIVSLGQERTGFAAAMALAITMLPIIARSSDVVLRVVPGGLREASMALGASHWQTVRRVVLPTARPGLATALILGIARGIGETAPVLITAGVSTFLNWNPFVNPMNSLPLFTYEAMRSGEPTYITRGYGAASVLLTIVIVLFIGIRLVARQRRTSR
jgi:phosphate transport system permease protein